MSTGNISSTESTESTEAQSYNFLIASTSTTGLLDIVQGGDLSQKE